MYIGSPELPIEWRSNIWPHTLALRAMEVDSMWWWVEHHACITRPTRPRLCVLEFKRREDRNLLRCIALFCEPPPQVTSFDRFFFHACICFEQASAVHAQPYGEKSFRGKSLSGEKVLPGGAGDCWGPTNPPSPSPASCHGTTLTSPFAFRVHTAVFSPAPILSCVSVTADFDPGSQSSRVKVEVSGNTLTVKVDPKNSKMWEDCAQVENVDRYVL